MSSRHAPMPPAIGPKRPRYPRSAHPLNAPAALLARGAEALGIGWSETPIATLSSPRGKAHPRVYRGMCTIVCSTTLRTRSSPKALPIARSGLVGRSMMVQLVNADCRSWDISNLWICDGPVFPTAGGANPSLTIQAIACRTADRIRLLQEGENYEE